MIRISPELVLVDPELAALARAQLADPSDCLARPLPSARVLFEPVAPPPPAEPAAETVPAEPVAPPKPAEPVAPPLVVPAPPEREPHLERAPKVPTPPVAAPRPRRVRRRVTVATGWVVVVGFVTSSLLAFIPLGSAERPTLVDSGPPAQPPPAPTVGSQTIRWAASTGAVGYAVVFVGGEGRIDRWVTKPSITVPTAESPATVVTYDWFVYPASRHDGRLEYGPLHASGTLRAPEGAPTTAG